MEAFLTSTFPFIKWDAIVGPSSQCCEGRGGKGQEGPVQCLRCSGSSLFPTVSAAALGARLQIHLLRYRRQCQGRLRPTRTLAPQPGARALWRFHLKCPVAMLSRFWRAGRKLTGGVLLLGAGPLCQLQRQRALRLGSATQRRSSCVLQSSVG